MKYPLNPASAEVSNWPADIETMYRENFFPNHRGNQTGLSRVSRASKDSWEIYKNTAFIVKKGQTGTGSYVMLK